MDQFEAKADEMLRFQARRAITNTFKSMLGVLEDMAAQHDSAYSKLKRNLPAELRSLIEVSDYLTDEQFDAYRSKILGIGNNSIREFEDQLKNFDIKLKE